jgi:RHS repeat-associated protein
VRTRSQRDQLGRLQEQRISVGLGGRQHVRTRTYGWQAGDRLTQIQDSAHGLTRYEHDAVGNLAATTFGDGRRQLRAPDAVGNLFATAGQQDRRYGPAGQLLEAAGTRYAYDALGNLAGKTTAQGAQWAYNWNAAGHLAEVVRPDGGVVRFAYDALGRRVSKSYQGQVTRWVWDGDKPLHEWTALEVGPGAGSVEALVTWLFEEESFAPAARLTAAGSQSVVADHLGTPLALYDAGGTQTWEAQLDSYGAVRQGRGQAQGCPFRYQGQYEDVETGLYYNRFRYYDPEGGQYISQDPIRLRGGQQFYGYTANPLNYIDPLGLSGIDVFRGMTNDNGSPQIAQSARGLGARVGPGLDIEADAHGMVHPGTGGISVAPSVGDLPAHRRPPEFGGTGKDPVWKMNTDDLGSDLKHVADKPGHGTIQPSRSMHVDDYQKALAETQQKWKKVCPK